MKMIPQPNLEAAIVLTPAKMNNIHFGGNHTPITPEQLEKLAKQEAGQSPKKTE